MELGQTVKTNSGIVGEIHGFSIDRFGKIEGVHITTRGGQKLYFDRDKIKPCSGGQW